ncbi:MAG: hypothetical protein H7249_17285 [Chitinophagaceae bacterium]|nr:hypothetical protein [Oligoflexus sp.]
MDFVPEIVDGAVILNAVDICTVGNDCRQCTELSVGIHNWLVAHQLRYLVLDFRDEKYVCLTILTELLQLRKRMRFPFLFCGMMEGPRKFLLSYAYNEYPFFLVPEDAVAYLKAKEPQALTSDLSSIKMGEPIPCTRSRSYRTEEVDVEVEEPES